MGAARNMENSRRAVSLRTENKFVLLDYLPEKKSKKKRANAQRKRPLDEIN